MLKFGEWNVQLRHKDCSTWFCWSSAESLPNAMHPAGALSKSSADRFRVGQRKFCHAHHAQFATNFLSRRSAAHVFHAKPNDAWISIHQFTFPNFSCNFCRDFHEALMLHAFQNACMAQLRLSGLPELTYSYQSCVTKRFLSNLCCWACF
jgi:hypothetical protein